MLKKQSLKPGFIEVEGIKIYIYPFSKGDDTNLTIVPIQMPLGNAFH